MRLKMKRNGDEKNGAENYGLVGNYVDEMGLTARTIDGRFRQQKMWEQTVDVHNLLTHFIQGINHYFLSTVVLKKKELRNMFKRNSR